LIVVRYADLCCCLFADHRPHATEVDLSEPIPERADIRQLRTQAKELLRALQSGEVLADGVKPGEAKLADAQLLIARKYGFDSWPKLVDKIETPVLVEKFKNSIYSGDVETLEKLLKTKPSLGKLVNEPIFHFDSQAIVRAAGSPDAAKLLPVLVRYGADPNIRSKWWAGGFSALDGAKGDSVDLLLELGAKFDVWSAAGQGRIDELRALLDADPSSVNAPGGDGERPLHFAATAEIAELLIERGADLEQRDVDHEGTPIQYQVNNRDVVRVLLSHGARPDIFTAAAWDDLELARRIIESDPSAVDARIGKPPFVTTASDGGHIYIYRLGPDKTPHQVAVERGSRSVLDELLKHSMPSRRLVAAALLEDADAVAEILRAYPGVGKEMGADARSITDAAQAGKTETVRLLLQAGLDPTTPGMDSGSALHVACWFGYVDVVKLLVDRVPINLRDANHGSPPLGWAGHGSQNCRNPKGDYVGVVETLLIAGADPNYTANSGGTSMLAQAGQREDVKAVLRKYGAK
jgi:ankyrin repeat protein